MQAKTIASLFETFQRLTWDAPVADYDVWQNATETAQTLGGKFTKLDEDYSTVTFPNGSSAVVHDNGAEVHKAA